MEVDKKTGTTPGRKLQALLHSWEVGTYPQSEGNPLRDFKQVIRLGVSIRKITLVAKGRLGRKRKGQD